MHKTHARTHAHRACVSGHVCMSIPLSLSLSLSLSQSLRPLSLSFAAPPDPSLSISPSLSLLLCVWWTKGEREGVGEGGREREEGGGVSLPNTNKWTPLPLSLYFYSPDTCRGPHACYVRKRQAWKQRLAKLRDIAHTSTLALRCTQGRSPLTACLSNKQDK